MPEHLEVEREEELTESQEPLSEYELETGKPMPNINHGIVQAKLTIAFARRYDAQYTIACEVTLDLKGKPRTPDLCLFEKFTTNWQHAEAQFHTPPLLAIEILSPSQGWGVFEEKMLLYFECGVKSVWLVQPELESVAVFAPDLKPLVIAQGNIIDKSLGIEIPLTELFT